MLKRWKNEHEERVSEAESGLSTELVVAVRNLQAQLAATAEAKLNVTQTEFDEKIHVMEERLRSLIEACGQAKAERDGLAIQLKFEKDALEKMRSSIQILEVGQRIENARLEQQAKMSLKKSRAISLHLIEFHGVESQKKRLLA